MTNIKPCPFCGGDPEVGPLATVYHVSCNGEGHSVFVVGETEAEAIAAWNRRHD